MATLFKRKNGIFYIKWQDLDGKWSRMSLKTTKRREAEALRVEMEKQIAAEESGTAKELLDFDAAWTRYEVSLVPHKPKSMYGEGNSWKKFSAFCKDQGVSILQDVKVADVSEWQATMLTDGYEPGGINHRFRDCKCVWNHLIRLQLFEGVNPFTKVKLLKEERKTKFLEWGLVKNLMDKAKERGRDIHLVFVLGALAGMRKGEILGARWEHVNWQDGTLFVAGSKTVASADYVPLHTELREALELYREPQEGWIVKPDNEPTTRPHSYRWDFRDHWAAVMKAAEIEHVTPHMLRHSVATHLLDLGYTLQQVARFLRHANDIPTRRYADLKGVSLVIDKF